MFSVRCFSAWSVSWAPLWGSASAGLAAVRDEARLMPTLLVCGPHSEGGGGTPVPSTHGHAPRPQGAFPAPHPRVPPQMLWFNALGVWLGFRNVKTSARDVSVQTSLGTTAVFETELESKQLATVPPWLLSDDGLSWANQLPSLSSMEVMKLPSLLLPVLPSLSRNNLERHGEPLVTTEVAVKVRHSRGCVWIGALRHDAHSPPCNYRHSTCGWGLVLNTFQIFWIKQNVLLILILPISFFPFVMWLLENVK